MTSKKKSSNKLNENPELKKESKDWADSFHIKELDLFYRKDKNGIWYDVEGFRVASPFMIKGNYLISLNGKTILNSIAFRGKSLFTSIKKKLVQLDKIVFDEKLIPINYLGHKVTEIGQNYIEFSDNIIQEIQINQHRKAFISIEDGTPFLIENHEITEHVATINESNLRFEVFSDGQNNYWLKSNSIDVLRIDEDPINIDPDSIVSFNDKLLAKAYKHRRPHEIFYINLENLETFIIDDISKESIIHIGKVGEEILGDNMHNIQTENKSFVYNVDKKEIYKPESLEFTNFQIKPMVGFESHFCLIILKDKSFVFDKTREQLLELEDRIISHISSKIGDKLLNARDENNQSLVLDARRGLDEISLAYSESKIILKVEKPVYPLGRRILQYAHISTLGGQEKRYIDLNTEELMVFTLPSELRSYPEQPNPSLYAGRPVISIDFDNPIRVEEVTFLNATFISFTDRIEKLLLQENNGEPLHFVGPKHRNELVSYLNSKSLEKAYFLGDNRLITCTSLDEAGLTQQLLFSIKQHNSWLAFNDQFLPILKDIIEMKADAAWEYYLLELREKKKEREFLVIEKEAPYRILVEKKSNRYQPKILKSNSPLPQIPEEVSAFKKLFFEDPGILINFN